MRRLGLAVFFIILALGGYSNLAWAEPIRPYISDYKIDYNLGRDSERRSVLDVVETITVEYPENANKGLVREIPSRYNGHSLSLKIESITRNGQPEPVYSEYNQGDLHVLETGTDDFINGTQVFQIKYSMRDVIHVPDDDKIDEFFWDTNGTGWRSEIVKLTVNLRINDSLLGSMTGKSACYLGSYGETSQCAITSPEKGLYTLSVDNLAPGENASIAFGLQLGTFVDYQLSLWERMIAGWIFVTVITTAVGVILIFWLVINASITEYRSKELEPIAPEYTPPTNASVTSSLAVTPLGVASSAMAAQLVDLAVKHYIQIIETKPKSTFGRAEYDIKVVSDIADLRREEQEILKDMFGHSPRVGEQMSMSSLQNNTSAFTRFSDNDVKLQKLIKQRYGLKEINEANRARFKGLSKKILIFSVLTLSPALLIAAGVAKIISATLWTLSDSGLELRRYLKGLEMYIKTAEAERLKMLQSPEGAEKSQIDPNIPAQVVRLYERVLPYAILFGQEKEWSKSLGNFYQDSGTSPDWYGGSSAFNAAAFSSAMSSFSSSARATSASASSSSSSSGSSGGGFSGGGGGGGGGGFR